MIELLIVIAIILIIAAIAIPKLTTARMAAYEMAAIRAMHTVNTAQNIADAVNSQTSDFTASVELDGSLRIETATVGGSESLSVSVDGANITQADLGLSTLTGANVVSIDVTDASLFIGTGHPGLDATTHVMEATPTDGTAVGFTVSVGFKMVTATTATASYSGIEVNLTNAALVGVDGVEFWAQGIAKVNSAPTAQRVDWAIATSDSAPANDPNGLLVDLDIEPEMHHLAPSPVGEVLYRICGDLAGIYARHGQRERAGIFKACIRSFEETHQKKH